MSIILSLLKVHSLIISSLKQGYPMAGAQPGWYHPVILIYCASILGFL
jgi:hypothetical protein